MNDPLYHDSLIVLPLTLPCVGKGRFSINIRTVQGTFSLALIHSLHVMSTSLSLVGTQNELSTIGESSCQIFEELNSLDLVRQKRFS